MADIFESTRGIIHGPSKTKRLGSVLTIDLSAPQENLVVERGSSLPRASLVVTTCARRMIELSKAGEKVEAIVVTGSDLDPTAYPNLREVTDNLRVLRGKWFPRAKLCLITMATDLESYDLRLALAMYDRIFLHYEWGTAKTFAAVTGAKRTALAALTRHLSNLDHIVVQANFFRGAADNSTEGEVNGWIRKLQEVRPVEVHILTGIGEHVRKKVRAITRTRCQQIADMVAEKTGLAVSIHEPEPLVV